MNKPRRIWFAAAFFIALQGRAWAAQSCGFSGSFTVNNRVIPPFTTQSCGFSGSFTVNNRVVPPNIAQSCGFSGSFTINNTIVPPSCALSGTFTIDNRAVPCYPGSPCDDTEACTTGDTCDAGHACVGTLECRLYGDLALAYCLIDVDDLLCALDGFSGIPPCDALGDIVASDFSCGPDGLDDVSDLLAVLDAFSGLGRCSTDLSPCVSWGTPCGGPGGVCEPACPHPCPP